MQKGLRITRPGALGATLILLFAGEALAHHPILGKFDQDTRRTLEGIVTKVDWRNPHAHIFINTDESGETVNWAVEIESPSELHISGWNRESLTPGDAIVVSGMLARDGSRQIWGNSVRRASNSQQLFTLDPDLPRLPLESRPAPRWPDGQIALGAISGASDGYWGYPTKTALIEDGVAVPMSPDGQLADISDADMERLDIHMVPCRIQFGDHGYLDKVSITIDEFYEELKTSPHHPTTSQPAPGDFRRQFQFLASHFDDVISINLTSAASGTFQAAELAAARTDAPVSLHEDHGARSLPNSRFM